MRFYADVTIHRGREGTLTPSLTVEATDLQSALSVLQAWGDGLASVTSVTVAIDSVSAHPVRRREYLSFMDLGPELVRFLRGES